MESTVTLRRFYVTVRERRRYFETLDAARAYADLWLQQRGIILGIEQEA